MTESRRRAERGALSNKMVVTLGQVSKTTGELFTNGLVESIGGVMKIDAP